jgi:glycosidase
MSHGLTDNDVQVLKIQADRSFASTIDQLLLQYDQVRDAFFRSPDQTQPFHAYRDVLLTLMYKERATAAIEAVEAWEKTHLPLHSLNVSNQSCSLADGVVYELYADLFTRKEDGTYGGFTELEQLLWYFEDLGITHLWVLPPFASPKIDAGFDVQDRQAIHPDLGGNPAFISFVQQAEAKGIRVMVDMVLNHLSYQSLAFQASSNPNHPEHQNYKDWFIWRSGDRYHPQEDLPAWVIFKEMMIGTAGQEFFPDVVGKPKKSNWTWVEPRNAWVYTRFFPQMPDVNFDYIPVLVEELDCMDFWVRQTNTPMVYRYDAVRHVFKRDRHALHPDYQTDPNMAQLIESYACDNLPEVHLLVRLLRAYAEHNYPKTEIITEVWDTPEEIKRYTGPVGEGAHQFDFDFMMNGIRTVISKDKTFVEAAQPRTATYPSGRTAVGFLRHHDAISAQDVGDRSEEQTFAQNPAFQLPHSIILSLQHFYPNFDKQTVYEDTGISARLRLLIEAIEGTSDEQKILEASKQALALLFTYAKTPMIYMGDEWGETNNYEYLVEKSIGNGKDLPGIDLRNASRAIRPFSQIQQLLNTPDSYEAKLHSFVKELIKQRKNG